MTRKVVCGLSLLFLFVFAFGFGFALVTTANDDLGGCCNYDWCDGYEGIVLGAQGHWIKAPDDIEAFGPGDQVCVFTGEHRCDVAYLCPPVR